MADPDFVCSSVNGSQHMEPVGDETNIGEMLLYGFAIRPVQIGHDRLEIGPPHLRKLFYGRLGRRVAAALDHVEDPASFGVRHDRVIVESFLERCFIKRDHPRCRTRHRIAERRDPFQGVRDPPP